MLHGSRITIFMLGGLVLLTGFFASLGLWSWQSSDDTHVLAALVEQTPTPFSPITETPNAPTTNQKERQARFVRVFGAIQNIQGSVLTVASAGKKMHSFETNAQTQFIVGGKPNATIDDLNRQDKVLVLSAPDSPGTPRVVIAAPATFTRENVLAGRIESVSDTQLTLKSKNGSKTISLEENTKIFGAQLAKTTVSELQPNMPVLILGEPDGADSVTARVVLAFPNLKAKTPGQNAPANRPLLTTARVNSAFGTVMAIDDTTLQLQPAPLDPQTLALDADTKIIVAGKPDATRADIQTGSKILALGAPLDTGKPRTPRALIVLPSDYTRANFVLGKVQSAQSNQLVMRTLRGQITVNLDAGVQVLDRTLQPQPVSDWQSRNLLVIGPASGDTIQAQIIFVRTKP